VSFQSSTRTHWISDRRPEEDHPAISIGATLHPSAPPAFQKVSVQSGTRTHWISDSLSRNREDRLNFIGTEVYLLERLPPPMLSMYIHTMFTKLLKIVKRAEMCHRRIEFTKYSCECVILTRQGDVDCLSRECWNSRSHPRDCNPCRCQRYFEHTERTTTTVCTAKLTSSIHVESGQ